MATQNNSREIAEQRTQLKKLLFLAKNQRSTVINLEQELKASNELFSAIEKDILETVKKLRIIGDDLPSKIEIKMPKGLVITIETRNGYQGISFSNNTILTIDEVDKKND